MVNILRKYLDLMELNILGQVSEMQQILTKTVLLPK